MNFVFVSPNFPRRYYKWVEALRERGITVLGIGDSPTYDLHPRLKASLNEYYFLPDLSDFPKMKEAVAYYERKYGKIDYIESDNEWWLEMDARLREAFGVNSGFHPEEMRRIKAKSAMKECFKKGGALTMRYVLADGPEDLDKVLAFAKEVGYPLFAKPDVGVGASDSYKLRDEAAVRAFLKGKLVETHIVEEYIDGEIVSFDGICDSKGDVAFMSSDHFPTPIADIVNEGLDYYYYNNPFELPMGDIDREAFKKVGQGVVKAFGIKKRFFHIEFFVLKGDKPGLAKKGDFVALECNMRPPGGYTPDLIDFGGSLSCYEIYADIVAYDENRQNMGLEKYYAFASHRLDRLSYLHSPEEIKAKYWDKLCMEGRYPAHMAAVMGDQFYYAKFKTIEEGLAFDKFVREKAQAK